MNRHGQSPYHHFQERNGIENLKSTCGAKREHRKAHAHSKRRKDLRFQIFKPPQEMFISCFRLEKIH